MCQGYPRDPACCSLQLPFEDGSLNTDIVIVPEVMLAMMVASGF